MTRKLQIPFISTLFLFGCQTTPSKDFEKLKVGMEKADVLDVMGAPQRTQRWKGHDRWTYIYYDEVSRTEKEVHFNEGKADYVGPVVVPAISAADQDAKNEAENVELEKKWAAQREERKQNLIKFESDVQGTDEVRYVPQFVPVENGTSSGSK